MWHFIRKRFEGRIQGGLCGGDGQHCYLFVMHAEHLLHCMRERPVANIVQQRGGASCGAIRWRNSIAELIEDARHQVKRAEAVGES